jgi:hypothetical protein
MGCANIVFSFTNVLLMMGRLPFRAFFAYQVRRPIRPNQKVLYYLPEDTLLVSTSSICDNFFASNTPTIRCWT